MAWSKAALLSLRREPVTSKQAGRADCNASKSSYSIPRQRIILEQSVSLSVCVFTLYM